MEYSDLERKIVKNLFASNHAPWKIERGTLSSREFVMGTVKVAIILDRDLLCRLDELVERDYFPSRSAAVQEAIREKLERLDQSPLARECAKLDPQFEQRLADEGLAADW
jgi:Arc/MetJ-type ribon-helix-helix transcriptional regulator